MKKKSFIICFITLIVIKEVFASKITDQRAVMLLNYLQYSATQICENPYRTVAEEEFNSIINNINPTTLKDSNIIQAYGNLLNSISDVKILDEQKEHISEMAIKERKLAITNIFKSPGSIFVPGNDPILSLAYVTISAGLNYANAIGQISNKKAEQEFKIHIALQGKIDKCRRDLYTQSAKVFQDRTDNYNLVNPELMSDFIEAVNLPSISERKTRLERIQHSLEFFPPFWYAYGYAQQQLGLYKEALNSYSKYETILGEENVLNYDEILGQINLERLTIYNELKTPYNHPIIGESFSSLKTIMKKAPLNVQVRFEYAMAIAYKMYGDTKACETCLDEIKKFGFKEWNDTVDSLISNKTYKSIWDNPNNLELINTISEYKVNSFPELNYIKELLEKATWSSKNDYLTLTLNNSMLERNYKIEIASSDGTSIYSNWEKILKIQDISSNNINNLNSFRFILTNKKTKKEYSAIIMVQKNGLLNTLRSNNNWLKIGEFIYNNGKKDISYIISITDIKTSKQSYKDFCLDNPSFEAFLITSYADDTLKQSSKDLIQLENKFYYEKNRDIWICNYVLEEDK